MPDASGRAALVNISAAQVLYLARMILLNEAQIHCEWPRKSRHQRNWNGVLRLLNRVQDCSNSSTLAMELLLICTVLSQKNVHENNI